jgi:hypothetical protein
MPNRRIGNINAFPAPQPQLPAQIDILAVHEIQACVELTHRIKSLPPDQSGRTRTPCRFAGSRLNGFGMLAWILSSFANRNPAIGLHSRKEFLNTPFVDLRVGIKKKNEFRLAHLRESIHTTGKAVVPDGSEEMGFEWK